MTKKTFFWFRRDLRLKDNVGLLHALKSEFPVIPVFFFDPHILGKLKDKKDKRVTFLHDTLLNIKEELNEKGSDLLVIYDKPENGWKKLIESYDIDTVFANEDYEPYALKRDERIAALLKKSSIELSLHKDQCIFAKNDILKADGTPYTVYTPYKRRWYENLKEDSLNPVATTRYHKNFAQVPKHIKKSKMITMKEMGFERADMPELPFSIKSDLVRHYEQRRDIPALDATSRLGIHLRFGTVSVRKCASVGRELSQTWLDELIWREFFMQILFHFPHVVDAPFKSKYEKIPWINDKNQFKVWCEGKTGYPFVDAGMRELNETGFMHNRVRMIVASFLVKHLLIDWRWGEKYFAEKLLDFELSANNGNWQWAAGTGCDAAPYFRIFNPMTQIKKFDKDYEYIQKWVPEYGTPAYPHPMVEHKMAYARAKETYKRGLDLA